MAKIELTRSSEYANRLRKFKVLLDDREIGTISNGETKMFEVPEGQHTLRTKIDWLASSPIDFNLEEDEVKRFKTNSFAKHNPLGVFAAIFYVTVASDKYLHLEEL